MSLWSSEATKLARQMDKDRAAYSRATAIASRFTALEQAMDTASWISGPCFTVTLPDDQPISTATLTCVYCGRTRRIVDDVQCAGCGAFEVK